MESILINRTKEDLLQQFQYIKQVENFNYRQLYAKQGFIVIGLTSLFLCLFFFTDASILITLKAVLFYLIGIVWIFILSFILWHLIKRQKMNVRIRKIVNSEINTNKEYYMSFNDEGIIHSSNDYKSELKWNYFVGYLENSKCILLFPEGSIYSCISFSVSEIGQDNFSSLKGIVRERIPVLNKKISL